MKFKKAVLVDVPESALEQSYWEQLDELIESRVYVESKNREEIINQLANADCLLVGFQINVGKEVIDAAPDLKYIGVLATAYGTIDIKYAASKNILVSNLAGYSSEAVAEFTIAAILWHIRNIQEGLDRAKNENYDFTGISARELRGSNFGVIGLGNIGNRVAELAAGFGANVSYWSRNKKDVSFTYEELNELLSSSDYISVNIAQAPDTERLLNASNIPLIKSGGVLISTVPPEIVDTDALAQRLTKNDITYISDHPDEMSPEELAKIKDFDNCVLFPPIAFVTKEAKVVMQEMFIANTKTFLEGKPQNRVN